MSESTYYVTRLKKDLVEQFRGKPRIEALCEVIGKQLQEVCDFFCSILTDTTLDSAVGVHLDKIGSIVQLTRQQASNYLETDNADDEQYRNLLRYKIAYNTGDGSFDSIIRCLKIIYGEDFQAKLYETSEHPAAIILEFERFVSGLGSEFGKYPIPKAAGVGLRLRGRLFMDSTVYTGASFERKQEASFDGVSHADEYVVWSDQDGNVLADGNGDIFIY